ncbi:MAG: FAD-dependent oxidoreductase, partial [Mycobacteriales bacterium]
MARYSAIGLLGRGLVHRDWPRVWHDRDLAPAYDVVIIGAGVHGLATAYYLAANHGLRNVAVLDRAYVGGGGSGRNTAIVRSNYLTPEGVRFYDRSVKLYESLAAELNFNVMFSQRGHLTLAHNDGSLRTMRWRAEVNKLEGISSEVIGPAEISKLVPFMDVSSNTRYPILGA